MRCSHVDEDGHQCRKDEHDVEARHIYGQCITCDEKGHTYLECTTLPFGSIVASSFGVPDLVGGESATQVRERVAVTQTEIARRRQERHRAGEISWRVIPTHCRWCGAGGACVTEDPEESMRWVDGFDSCAHDKEELSDG